MKLRIQGNSLRPESPAPGAKPQLRQAERFRTRRTRGAHACRRRRWGNSSHRRSGWRSRLVSTSRRRALCRARRAAGHARQTDGPSGDWRLNLYYSNAGGAGVRDARSTCVRLPLPGEARHASDQGGRSNVATAAPPAGDPVRSGRANNGCPSRCVPIFPFQ